MLWSAWLMGFVISGTNHESFEVALTVCVTVPWVSIAAQLPLWVVRQSWGWRLVREAQGIVVVREPPLTIRDLFLATLLVASALGLARLGAIPEKARWAVWGIAFLFASFISTIAILPAGALLLRMRDFRRALVVSGLYLALWIVLQWSVLLGIWFYAPAAATPLAFNVGISALMHAFAGTVTVVATVARANGYRLVCGHNQLAR